MPNESQLWETMRNALRPFGSLKRIENKLEEGTPDVNFALTFPRTGRTVSGWCELKHLEAWPKRPTTMVAIRHLTVDQVLFLENWRGLAFLLLRVGACYMVHSRHTARRIYERQLNTKGVLAAAEVTGHGAFPVGDFLRWLNCQP